MGKTKICLECRDTLSIDNFRVYKTSTGTYIRSDCKTCERLKSHEYSNTFKGFFVTLLDSAKQHAAKRKTLGRISAGIFDLTYDQIVDLYNKQNGRCYYSNIPMSIERCSNWKCSLERLDDDNGYTIDNVALVCLEFNNKLKWTREKLQELIVKTIEQHDITYLHEEIETALAVKSIRSKNEDPVFKTINGIKHYECADCRKNIPLNSARKKFIKRCVPCQRVIKKRYRATLKGHLLTLLSHAKSHTKERKETKSRKTNTNIKDKFNLTYSDALDIFKSQHGLCYYSGIKMNYGSVFDNNWVASLERINASKGYTKDNVCFICYEFNTTDNTVVFKHNSSGTGNWSINKFLHFYKTTLATKKFNLDDYLDDPILL